MADLRRIYIRVPEGEGSKSFVSISCNEATDHQFNWWINSWVDKGAFVLEDNDDKGISWTLKERMDMIDWMRDIGITIHEINPKYL